MFGSSAPRERDALYQFALDLGRQLADAGFDLINGGHEGTMEAASRGARLGGAVVTGVTSSSIRKARGALLNRYLHLVVDAPTLFARIETMMRRAGGYVVLEGGRGTLAELALVWEHVGRGVISRRPIVCIGSYWKPLIAQMASVAGEPACIVLVDSAEAAVDLLAAEAIDVGPTEAGYLAPGSTVQEMCDE